jgi:hypothetical protein
LGGWGARRRLCLLRCASWPPGAPWLAGAPYRSQSGSSLVSPHHGHRPPTFSGPVQPPPAAIEQILLRRPPSSASSSAGRGRAPPPHPVRSSPSNSSTGRAPTAGPGAPPPPRATDHHLPRVSCPDEPHPGAGLAKGVGKQGGRSHNFLAPPHANRSSVRVFPCAPPDNQNVFATPVAPPGCKSRRLRCCPTSGPGSQRPKVSPAPGSRDTSWGIVSWGASSARCTRAHAPAHVRGLSDKHVGL